MIYLTPLNKVPYEHLNVGDAVISAVDMPGRITRLYNSGRYNEVDPENLEIEIKWDHKEICSAAPWIWLEAVKYVVSDTTIETTEVGRKLRPYFVGYNLYSARENIGHELNRKERYATMMEWCRENCHMMFNLTNIGASFASEDDALMFRLKWS